MQAQTWWIQNDYDKSEVGKWIYTTGWGNSLSFFFVLCVCMCVYKLCMCIWRQDVDVRLSPVYFKKGFLHWNCSSSMWLDWLSRKCQGVFCDFLSGAGIPEESGSIDFMWELRVFCCLLNIYLIFFMCMCVLPIYYILLICGYLWRPEDGTGSLEARVTGIWL